MDQHHRVPSHHRDGMGDRMTVWLAFASIWGVSAAVFAWLMWVEVIRPELKFRRVERERDAEDSQVAALDAVWVLPAFDPEAV